MQKRVVDREPSFMDDLKKRQSNVLPPDLISNDRHTDDVLWHGPAAGSCMQQAGAFVIGAALTIAGLSLIAISLDKGFWPEAIIPTVIAAAGLRVMYKSIVGRKTKHHRT